MDEIIEELLDSLELIFLKEKTKNTETLVKSSIQAIRNYIASIRKENKEYFNKTTIQESLLNKIQASIENLNQTNNK